MSKYRNDTISFLAVPVNALYLGIVAVSGMIFGLFVQMVKVRRTGGSFVSIELVGTVVLSIVIYLLVWLVFSQCMSAFRGGSISRSLRRDSLTFLPTVLLLLNVRISARFLLPVVLLLMLAGKYLVVIGGNLAGNSFEIRSLVWFTFALSLGFYVAGVIFYVKPELLYGSSVSGDIAESAEDENEFLASSYRVQFDEYWNWSDQFSCKEMAWSPQYGSIDTYLETVDPLLETFTSELSLKNCCPPLSTLSAVERQLVEDRGDYLIERIAFPSRVDGFTVSGYLLVPSPAPEHSGNLPAVVALHGCGSYPDYVVGLTAAEDYSHRFGARLAQRGYVVLAPYNTCADKEETSRIAYTVYQRTGSQFLGLEIMKIMSSLDFLTTLPEVDASRIGLYGISHGGMLALYTAAIDRRVSAVVSAGWLTDWSGLWNSGYRLRGWVSVLPPAFFCRYDTAVVGAMIAPRPLAFEYGDQEGRFNAEKEYEGLLEVYRNLGYPERLGKFVFHGGHEIGGEEAFKWLDNWLAPNIPSQ